MMKSGQRKPYNGESRNVSRKKKVFKATIYKIFEERKFNELSVNKVAARSGISKNLIYRYFGTLRNLIDQFIHEVDYWYHLDPLTVESIAEQKNRMKQTFRSLYQYLLVHPDMCGLVIWELCENNRSTTEMLKRREQVSEGYFEDTDKLFGEILDFRAVSAILFAGIYHLSAYSSIQKVSFCGINTSEAQGQERILKAMDTILDKAYADIEQNPERDNRMCPTESSSQKNYRSA